MLAVRINLYNTKKCLLRGKKFWLAETFAEFYSLTKDLKTTKLCKISLYEFCQFHNFFLRDHVVVH